MGRKDPAFAAGTDTVAQRRTDRVTISDVAALAGVSTAAVSKIVNGKGSFPQATRDRVQRAVVQLNWAPSAAAVALRGARTRAIGMVAGRTPDVLNSDPHFALLIAGIESELAPRDHGLLLHIVGEQPDAAERAYRRLATERRVDGVILTESRVGDPRFALLRGLRLPAVLVGTPWQSDPVPTVRAAEQDQGMADAVEHLVGLGHRRIGYVSGPEDRVHTGRRRAVFTEALARHGLSPSHLLASDFAGQTTGSLVEKVLATADRPSALVLANDMMALAALAAAQRTGRQVPRDLSLIGHDDLPVGHLLHPRLTTVRQDLAGLGRAAALSVLQQLGEEPAGPLPEVTPPQLVVRESTGPAPG
ncbi:LacI family DNA-binding transcriptional regulator [Streptomyces physcomitrii]|uniref:LacI family DNA-binding transcriptional regulator n=1 Tax=Streptomyces physcomitrii TaxID=2724184 RepID=UPI0028AAE7AB|nr:LacI family DNA-binding transcriptional regulator [Streptomyces physcomitrii]